MPAKTVRGPLAYTDARSPAQAIAAARAVHECRVIVRGARPRDDALDNELHEFELALYRYAEEIEKLPARKQRKK